MTGTTTPSTPSTPAQVREVPAPRPDVEEMRSRIGVAVRGVEYDAAGDPILYVDPERNVEVLAHLKGSEGGSYDLLRDITGLDLGGGHPIYVVYDLWSTAEGIPLRVKAQLRADRPRLASACDLWRAANWLEREVYDMFGVTFQGHPDLRRILMPENYEEG